LAIELIGAAAFVISYLFFPDFATDVVKNTTLLAVWFVILTGFMILGLYDVKHSILPNKVLYPTMFVALLFFVLKNVFTAGDNSLLDLLIGLILSLLPISGFYLVLWIIGEKSGKSLVGLGDVKLGVVFAFLLSWQENITVLFLANILGAVLMALPLMLRKIKRTAAIPFGPFLIIAAATVFLSQLSIEKIITFMYNM
jgi:leader peptidase (prepilin peptidase)/N-methyltransferase